MPFGVGTQLDSCCAYMTKGHLGVWRGKEHWGLLDKK